jgi:hypothetical protein
MTEPLKTPQPYVYMADRQLTDDELYRTGLVPAPTRAPLAGHTCTPGTCGCGETDRA